MPAEGQVGAGGDVGKDLHDGGKASIGTIVYRWWPDEGGWQEAEVVAYCTKKQEHKYASLSPTLEGSVKWYAAGILTCVLTQACRH